MDLERERLIEIAISVVAVSVMFALLYFIGAGYSEGGELTERGGELLVYSIIGFVFLMTGAGVALAYVVSEDE